MTECTREGRAETTGGENPGTGDGCGGWCVRFSLCVGMQVCMCVYVHVSGVLSADVYVRMWFMWSMCLVYVCLSIWLCMCMGMFMGVDVYVQMCVCVLRVCKCMHIHVLRMFLCMLVYVYVYVYVSAWVCVCASVEPYAF